MMPTGARNHSANQTYVKPTKLRMPRPNTRSSSPLPERDRSSTYPAAADLKSSYNCVRRFCVPFTTYETIRLRWSAVRNTTLAWQVLGQLRLHVGDGRVVAGVLHLIRRHRRVEDVVQEGVRRVDVL